MDLFFCDIIGTISGLKKEERRDALKLFSENLSKLLNMSNSKKLVFSFISTSENDVINQYIKELKMYINDPRIEFGYHYGLDKKFKYNEKLEKGAKGKNLQILQEITNNNNNTINNVYYADDTIMYHKILDHHYSMGVIPAEKVISFIPGSEKKFISTDIIITNCSNNTDIKGLNECIENYIKLNTKENKTKLKYR